MQNVYETCSSPWCLDSDGSPTKSPTPILLLFFSLSLSRFLFMLVGVNHRMEKKKNYCLCRCWSDSPRLSSTTVENSWQERGPELCGETEETKARRRLELSFLSRSTTDFLLTKLQRQQNTTCCACHEQGRKEGSPHRVLLQHINPNKNDNTGIRTSTNTRLWPPLSLNTFHRETAKRSRHKNASPPRFTDTK